MKREHRKTLAVALVVAGVGLIFVLFNKTNLAGASTIDVAGEGTGTPLILFALLGAAIYGVVALTRKQKE